MGYCIPLCAMLDSILLELQFVGDGCPGNAEEKWLRSSTGGRAATVCNSHQYCHINLSSETAYSPPITLHIHCIVLS